MSGRGTFRSLESPRSRLVFPLDVPDAKSALALARELGGRAGFLKVGLELFVACGPGLLADLRAAAPESGIFLDLKLHDIPATVGRAMEAAARLGVDLATVHAQGGPAMMREAAERSGAAVVLGVTVLTSLDPADLGELSPENRSPGAYAALLAGRALAAGCGGLVCSSLETKNLRALGGPGPLLVTPGIRPAWSQVGGDDQKRVGTVGDALRTGADLLVVGRPIRDAPSPAEAADRVLGEIESALAEIKNQG
ncbi:MAG: orotidine-5'-phosphate decarboxylase [Deltaproteobacteria bacterium]|nr:orotidine-5'-phosphate decarboxylase [Deltaproteobacteria bacterium]